MVQASELHDIPCKSAFLLKTLTCRDNNQAVNKHFIDYEHFEGICQSTKRSAHVGLMEFVFKSDFKKHFVEYFKQSDCRKL